MSAPTSSTVRMVPRSAIRIEAGLTPRERFLDTEHVARLRDAKDRLPPLLVQRGTLILVGGHHRLAALEGDETVAVIEADIPDGELWEWALRDNVGHGLPMTHSERMKAARKLMDRHPDWSGPKLAEWSGVSGETFNRWRREDEHRAAREREDRGLHNVQPPSPVAREGRDGRVNTGGRPARTFDPGREIDPGEAQAVAEALEVDVVTGEVPGPVVGSALQFLAMCEAIVDYIEPNMPRPGEWLRRRPVEEWDRWAEIVPLLASTFTLFELTQGETE